MAVQKNTKTKATAAKSPPAKAPARNNNNPSAKPLPPVRPEGQGKSGTLGLVAATVGLFLLCLLLIKGDDGDGWNKLRAFALMYGGVQLPLYIIFLAYAFARSFSTQQKPFRIGKVFFGLIFVLAVAEIFSAISAPATLAAYPYDENKFKASAQWVELQKSEDWQKTLHDPNLADAVREIRQKKLLKKALDRNFWNNIAPKSGVKDFEPFLSGGLLGRFFYFVTLHIFDGTGTVVILTFLVVPTFFLTFDKPREMLVGWIRGVFARKSEDDGDEEESDGDPQNAQASAKLPSRRKFGRSGTGVPIDLPRKPLETQTIPNLPFPDDLDDLLAHTGKTKRPKTADQPDIFQAIRWEPLPQTAPTSPKIVPLHPHVQGRMNLIPTVIENLNEDDEGQFSVLTETPAQPTDPAAELAAKIAPGRTHRKTAQAPSAARTAPAAPIETVLPAAEPAPGFARPPLSCLTPPRANAGGPDRLEEERIARKLLATLDSFGVSVNLVGLSRGPSVTRYELLPAEGVKISKITRLADDIALRLAADKVRIEAPIPGMAAVGVEVPNKIRAVVNLREIIDSDQYRNAAHKSHLTVALGKDIVGSLVCTDLAKIPHLLIAGTTGSGKSVLMNALILSLLYNASPDEVKLLMIDPKQVEFSVYSGIPHMLVPVVSDSLKAAGALSWAVNEMERRYTLLSKHDVREIDSYNRLPDIEEKLPKIVIFIDELSDLMMAAPSDVEDAIQRLTQKARAAGIHLVVATQRPSVDVITGVIKSNLPGRIALSVASQIDSRTIINTGGAEQLLGNGDMLFSLFGGNNAVRVQGCFVADSEVKKVVSFIKGENGGESDYNANIWEEIERNAALTGSKKKSNLPYGEEGDSSGENEEILRKATQVIVDAQLASTTMLQKKLKLGYARASRLMDELEDRGIIGPQEGSRPRKVLLSNAQWEQQLAGTHEE